jgi:hypothetical protein
MDFDPSETYYVSEEDSKEHKANGREIEPGWYKHNPVGHDFGPFKNMFAAATAEE